MRGVSPNWPAPTWVRAITTTREGGVSKGSFVNFNLGLHVNDNPYHVARNRLLLSQSFNFKYEPQWLNQSHSTNVIEIKSTDTNNAQQLEADGAWTKLTYVPCVVLTADCLPLLLCDTQGTFVGALHCGWRGIADGIIENAIKAIRLQSAGEILAWLGPAIGQNHFEVGEEVREKFLKHSLVASSAFVAGKPGKWMANLYTLAQQRLNDMGVHRVYGGDYCTYTDSSQFYSYRRDKETGRMASLIWLALS